MKRRTMLRALGLALMGTFLMLVLGIFSVWRPPSYVGQAHADACYNPRSPGPWDVGKVSDCKLWKLVAANRVAVAPIDRASVRRTLSLALRSDDVLLRQIGIAQIHVSVDGDLRYGLWIDATICKFARTHRLELAVVRCPHVSAAQRLTSMELRELESAQPQRRVVTAASDGMVPPPHASPVMVTRHVAEELRPECHPGLYWFVHRNDPGLTGVRCTGVGYGYVTK